MAYHSLAEIQSDLQSGKISCRQLVRNYLDRINQYRPNLNAFREVYAEEALRFADSTDEKIKHRKSGKLAGMIIGIKDNICYKDHLVSAASKILGNFTSLYNATAVERLIAEDAIIIGRLNCDEFAMGSSNENSAYGNTLNPVNPQKVPGGSSGGSAAAVAADLCHAALGSDTGGSIRQPASFCGTFGLKPTYGRISRYGLIAYGSSFDQIGPLTRSVEDAALLLEVMAGPDGKDSTASRKAVPEYSKKMLTSGKAKIAYIKDCLEMDGLDPEVRHQTLLLIEKLKDDGHEVEAVDFPYLEYLVPAYYILSTAEASSNLSRYDGIHYGYRSPLATDVDSAYKKSRTEGFGKEVKRRIMLGTFVLSSGYYDAYYSKAQKARRILREKTLEILKNYQFILLPTTPNTAFGIGEIKDPVSMYLEDIFTVQANLCGLPAISLPIGQHSNGLPFGIQLMAAPFEEEQLLAFSGSLAFVKK